MKNISSISFSGNISSVSKNSNIAKTTSVPIREQRQMELSNITPAMKAVEIDSTKADMKKFSNVIKDYGYGKSSLINNPENFKVKAKDGEIQIYGFHQADTNLKEGICEELTYKAGIDLQKKFGDKYIFVPVKGTCSSYNMQHYYLTAVKKSPANEKKMQVLIDKSNEISTMAQSFIADMDSIKEKDIAEIEQKQKDVLNLKNEVLSNAVLIDPSFGIVKQFSEDGNVEGYGQDSFFDFETMNPFNAEPYTIPEMASMFGYQIPIGFAKDIAPDLNLSPDSLLFLNMDVVDDDNVELNIVSRTPDDFMFDDVEFDENHKLNKFIKNN